MIESLLAAWGDPHSRHAMLVHFLIVLGALGIFPAAALVICTASKRLASRILSWVCVVWFVAACVSLGLASGAGEEAYGLHQEDTIAEDHTGRNPFMRRKSEPSDTT